MGDQKDNDLKRCPCCGGIGCLDSVGKGEWGYQVNALCEKCGHQLMGYGDSEDVAKLKAKEAWNGFSPLRRMNH